MNLFGCLISLSWVCSHLYLVLSICKPMSKDKCWHQEWTVSNHHLCVLIKSHESELHILSPPAADKELLLRSQEEAQRLQRRAVRHQEKRDKIERHNRRLVELLERRTREQQSRLSQLAALRRDHILELTTHIFSMQEEKQGSRSANTKDTAGGSSSLFRDSSRIEP